MRLYDGGSPSRPSESTASIRVNVVRNLNAPVFFNEPYAATVRKDLGFGNSVLTVQATDADPEVSGHKGNTAIKHGPFPCSVWQLKVAHVKLPNLNILLSHITIFVIILWNSQDSYEVVQYEVLGDDSAPRFFRVNSESGVVTVAADFRDDTEVFYVVSTSISFEFQLILLIYMLPILLVVCLCQMQKLNDI